MHAGVALTRATVPRVIIFLGKKTVSGRRASLKAQDRPDFRFLSFLVVLANMIVCFEHPMLGRGFVHRIFYSFVFSSKIGFRT